MTIQLSGYPDNLVGEQVTIPAGAAASEMFSMQGRALVGIFMPAAWTAADIGYKASWDGKVLVTAYDGSGNVLQTPADTDQYIAFPQTDAVFAPFLQIQSVDPTDGTTGVNQASARTLTLILRKYVS